MLLDRIELPSRKTVFPGGIVSYFNLLQHRRCVSPSREVFLAFMSWKNWKFSVAFISKAICSDVRSLRGTSSISMTLWEFH